MRRTMAGLATLIVLCSGCGNETMANGSPCAEPGAHMDECGTCDADPDNDCVKDCAGTFGGAAYVDECGKCDADPDNDCVEDCAGTFGGAAYADECGTCDADPGNDCVKDCAGTFGGAARIDACGTCDADPTNDCVPTCAQAVECTVNCGDFSDACADTCISALSESDVQVYFDLQLCAVDSCVFLGLCSLDFGGLECEQCRMEALGDPSGFGCSSEGAACGI